MSCLNSFFCLDRWKHIKCQWTLLPRSTWSCRVFAGEHMWCDSPITSRRNGAPFRHAGAERTRNPRFLVHNTRPTKTPFTCGKTTGRVGRSEDECSHVRCCLLFFLFLCVPRVCLRCRLESVRATCVFVFIWVFVRMCLVCLAYPRQIWQTRFRTAHRRCVESTSFLMSPLLVWLGLLLIVGRSGSVVLSVVFVFGVCVCFFRSCRCIFRHFRYFITVENMEIIGESAENL